MRVIPKHPTERRTSSRRRSIERTAPAPQPAAEPLPDSPPPPDERRLAERRHRASVAPEDHAHYACTCGCQFDAAVSTTVACPNCGAAQAW